VLQVPFLVGVQSSPLIDYAAFGKDALLAIATPEHYLPLLYVLGASVHGEPMTSRSGHGRRLSVDAGGAVRYRVPALTKPLMGGTSASVASPDSSARTRDTAAGRRSR